MNAKKTAELELCIDGAMADRVGPVHGLSSEELGDCLQETARRVGEVEEERRQGQHRYRELPYDKAMLRTVSAAARRYRGKMDNLVVLGIGGSALGNIAIQTALNSPVYNLLPRKVRRGPRLFVMDNVDPVQFGALLGLLKGELRGTLFNVISKSGETAETAAQFLIVGELLARRLGVTRARERILVTTDPQRGALRGLAEKEGYESLPVPEGVGGRFSVLSAVGLFSAAMCGINIAGLLAGAAAMDARVCQATDTNPAAHLAAAHHLFTRRGKPLHVMLAYAYQLKGLADWYRQLWAESLGKRYTADSAREVFAGATPIKALGTTDQHSQIQLYREGPNDKVITFLAVGRFAREVRIPRALKDVPEMAYLGGSSLGRLLEAERRATELALIASQRPCLTLTFPRVTAHTVGQFIYLYEVATTLTARLLGVNPYDQPGVELGKKLTFHFMGRPGYETMPGV